jgi:processive 1,2-diacylglycerol beta-glucosyltransferase
MNEIRRVLLLSTSVGSGHVAAAAAIEQALHGAPGVEVRNQDALELASDTLRATYSDMYFRLVKDYPWLVGWWYDLQNEPFKGGQLRVVWEQLNAEPLIRLIREYDPDITICTHFMPAGIIAQLMARGELHTTLGIVMTDYEFQGMWLSPLFHHYFVPLDETKVHLMSLGIPEAHITVSGIPVDPVFSRPFDHAAVLTTYALRDDTPTLLVSAGAAGITSAPKIVEQLLRLQSDAQIVVVCGKNESLRREIDVLVAPQAERFRVLGYTKDMPSLLRVATLFIGKPGGLTSAECMAAGLPMVIIEPIPGQEERNSDHLLEEGAAIRCNQMTTMAFKIDRLLGDPKRLAHMRANTARLARADAAQTIVDTLLSADLAPHAIGRAERHQIVSAARGELPSERPAERPRGLINLYNDQTGVLLGTIDEVQFQVLTNQLEREGEADDDYYINQATIELLGERGADPALLDMLRAAVADNGEAEVRWLRQ